MSCDNKSSKEEKVIKLNKYIQIENVIYTCFQNSISPLAGFAVNLQVILSNPRALFKRRGAKPGMQESDFLKQITKVEDLEPKAKNCTQVSRAACICILHTDYQERYKNIHFLMFLHLFLVFLESASLVTQPYIFGTNLKT